MVNCIVPMYVLFVHVAVLTYHVFYITALLSRYKLYSTVIHDVGHFGIHHRSIYGSVILVHSWTVYIVSARRLLFKECKGQWIMF